jgi:hypothetical protein
MKTRRDTRKKRAVNADNTRENGATRRGGRRIV